MSENPEEKLKELESLFETVPFGNSQFQNVFMSACQETKARKYRHVLLQINQKLLALKESEFKLRRTKIEISKIEEDLNKAEGFTKELLQIDLEEKKWAMSGAQKLINDALIELNTFNSIRESLPAYSREEFEAEEKEYWKARLVGEAQLSLLSTGHIDLGHMQALKQIGLDPRAVQEELKIINEQDKLQLIEQILNPFKGLEVKHEANSDEKL